MNINTLNSNSSMLKIKQMNEKSREYKNMTLNGDNKSIIPRDISPHLH